MNQIAARTYDPKLVQKLYAKVAWMYDIWSRLTEEKALRTVMDWAEIHDGQQILEAGVGTGRLFSRIVRLNKNGRNVGIDLSESMLQKAHKRCNDDAKMQLSRADITNLPNDMGTFDCIISTYVLDLLPEDRYRAILLRFRSMLRTDGKLIIAYMESGNNVSHRFWSWVAETFPNLMTHCRPIHLESYLKQAGFVIAQKISFSQLTFPSCVIEAKAGAGETS